MIEYKVFQGMGFNPQEILTRKNITAFLEQVHNDQSRQLLIQQFTTLIDFWQNFDQLPLANFRRVFEYLHANSECELFWANPKFFVAPDELSTNGTPYRSWYEVHETVVRGPQLALFLPDVHQGQATLNFYSQSRIMEELEENLLAIPDLLQNDKKKPKVNGIWLHQFFRLYCKHAAKHLTIVTKNELQVTAVSQKLADKWGNMGL